MEGWIFAFYPRIIELMNPNQGADIRVGDTPQNPPAPAPQYPPRANVELSVPQRPVNVPIRDDRDTAIATPPANPANQPAPPPATQQDAPVAAMQPQANVAQSEPQIAPMPQLPTYPAAPATQPAQMPIQPAPIQQLPPQPQEARNVPMPADVLPPQQVPTVPTLSPAATPATQASAPSAPPVPNQQLSSPVPTASAASLVSFSPQQAAHLPDDIAARIAETPMQNSNDFSKKGGGLGGKFKGFLSFIVFVVSVVAAAFLINQFVFQSYYVEGTSMTPTLQNNDRLIISKVERTFALATGQPYIPERGQIVVLDSSLVGPNGQHEQLIKRVIGLPGERVRIENGVVTVFNTAHPQGIDVAQELGLTYLQAAYTEAPIDTTIPAGHVYVMGDNRGENGSYDSRAFGPVEGNKIQGRLWARVLPLDKARLY